MQANNIQLSLVVKPTAGSASKGASSGLLSSGPGSGEFGSWMQSAAKPAAQANRSYSNVLPPRGSDLPAADKSSDLAKANPQVTESSTRNAQAKSDATDLQSSPEAGKSDTAGQNSVEPEMQMSQVANVEPREGGSNRVNSDQDVSAGVVEEVVDLAAVDGEVSDDAVSSTEQLVVDSGQSEVETPAGQQAVESMTSEVNAQADTSLEGLFAANQAGQSQASGRVNSETPHPGVAHASPEGLEHGRVFQSLQGAELEQQVLVNAEESSPPGIAGTEGNLEEASVVQAPDTRAVDTEADRVQELVAPAITEEAGGAEVVQVADPEADVIEVAESDPRSGQEVQVAKAAQAAQDRTESERSAQTESSDIARVDPTLVAENGAAQSETETTAAAAMTGQLGASEARAAEPRSTAASQQPINTQASIATADTSAGSGQQSGADNQMSRQATAEQLAHSAAKANSGGSDAGAKGDGQSAASSSANASTNPTSATASTLATSIDSAARPQASVATAVPPQALNRMQQEQWGQRLGERTLMMVQQGPRVAYVQLDPPELGALQVRVHLSQGDQVSLNFTAPNAAVRDVLEQHLPRLREMFAEQGLNLAQSDVRDQSAGGRKGGDEGQSRPQGQFAGVPDDVELPFSEMSVPVGVVDFYA